MQILDISVSGRKFPKVDKPTLYQARNIPDLDFSDTGAASQIGVND